MSLRFRSATAALLLAALSPVVAADEAAPDLAQAATLRQQAQAVRSAAESRFSEIEVGCYRRFLVNRCLDQAKEERVQAIRRARELEQQADRIDLAEQNRRYAERKADEAATAAQQAIDRAETEARNRAETEARLSRFANKDAERIRTEQEAKARGMKEAEQRNRHEAATNQRRAAEAQAAARRAEQARQERENYAARAQANADKKAEKARKEAEKAATDKAAYEQRAAENAAKKAEKAEKSGAE